MNEWIKSVELSELEKGQIPENGEYLELSFYLLLVHRGSLLTIVGQSRIIRIIARQLSFLFKYIDDEDDDKKNVEKATIGFIYERNSWASICLTFEGQSQVAVPL